MTVLGVEEVMRLLGLKPLQGEGGYYTETYRSTHLLPPAALPAGYGAPRSAGTAMFYLLTADTFSRLHKLKGDEVYHFYLGDPVQMLTLSPEGSGETLLLGPNLADGQKLQHVVPGGVWQGSRLRPGGRFALMGTTMAPGFDIRDYESGDPRALAATYPGFAGLIKTLAPDVSR